MKQQGQASLETRLWKFQRNPYSLFVSSLFFKPYTVQTLTVDTHQIHQRPDRANYAQGP